MLFIHIHNDHLGKCLLSEDANTLTFDEVIRLRFSLHASRKSHRTNTSIYPARSAACHQWQSCHFILIAEELSEVNQAMETNIVINLRKRHKRDPNDTQRYW